MTAFSVYFGFDNRPATMLITKSEILASLMCYCGRSLPNGVKMCWKVVQWFLIDILYLYI